jgi:hypothetical protein
VAVVRCDEDRIDHLVLADAFVVLDRTEAGPQVVTDPREVDVRAECTVPLHGLRPGTAAYEEALPGVVSALRARRNQPGGYWLAKDDPAAAAEAVVSSVEVGQVRGAALLSNGAARFVDPYGLGAWPDLLATLRTHGPDEVLRRVRAAEADRPHDVLAPDDASVVSCEIPLPRE